MGSEDQMRIIAKTTYGLEEVLVEELKHIGVTEVEVATRAVIFEGTKETLYKANIWLRSANRLIVPIKTFKIKSTEDLYDKVKMIAWEDIFNVDQTFAIDSTVFSDIFNHTKFPALKSKDAIADRFVEKYGKRPNVNVLEPTYRLTIHIRDTRATLSLDSSAESLHMRGYRANTVDAPINEALAAGLLLLSRWNGDTPFMDPMCGSGTILIEAARLALNHPTQRKDRNFGFKRWKSYDKDLYEKVYQDQLNKRIDKKVEIYGQDKSLRSVKVTQQNLIEAGLNDKISVIKKDFFKTYPPKGVTVITNPPYDTRLKEDNIGKFYRDMGDKFHKDFLKSDPWIFSGNLEALEEIDLGINDVFNLMNGGMPAKLVNYYFD